MSFVMNEEMQRKVDSISHVGSERAVLSIAIKNPETLFDIAADLEPEELSNSANKNIYRIMLSILDSKYANIGKVNPMIIYAIAQNSGIAEDIGGMQYLEILSKTEAGEENLKFYMDKVKQASVRRQTFSKAVSVMDDCLTCEEEEVESFTSRQEEKFLDIVMQTSGKSEVVKIGDCIDIHLEAKEEAPREVLGIPTGFPEYDKATGGLVPGRFKVIAAPPKTGKSAAALNIAKNIAIDEGIPVLYIDTEMPTHEQIDRLTSIVASETGVIVPERLITSGMYSRNPKMKDAVDNYAKPLIRNAPLYHIYMPDFTVEKVHNLARKMQRQIGVEWNGYEGQFVLIFDYLKMGDGDFRANVQEYQVLGQMANTLKNKTAGMLNIPVLGFAQLNPRTTQNAEDVDSSHMSGSNRIVMFVNELAFLRKKTAEEKARDGKDNGNLVLKLGETRNGGSYLGWIDYGIHQGITSMKEIRNVALE